MKSSILAAGLWALVASGASHAVNVTSITNTGFVNNDPAALLVDGDFGLNTWWTDAPNVWWTFQTTPNGDGTGNAAVVITLAFDQLYTLTDATIGVDNNDFYAVQISQDNVTWNTLFVSMSAQVDLSYAYEGGSMIKRSSDSTAAGYSPLIDFAPTQARYARIYAITGDSQYAVSEVQFAGTPAVPEPETWALVLTGLGAVGMSVARRRNRA